MNNDKIIKQLADQLALQRMMITAHAALFLQLRITQQEYANAVKACIPRRAKYRSQILDSLSKAAARPQTEKETLADLGIDDILGPSGGFEPGEVDPK